MTETPLRSGKRLDDRYTLIRKLGTGSTGAVWLAQAPHGAIVACKILHPSMRNNRRVVGQLIKEADILAQLEHPNITQQIEICTQGSSAYLVMEYVDGQPLHELLGSQTRRGRHFAGGTIRALFRPLCAAVEYAHANQIVHRDVKPQNVMVVDTGDGPSVKMLDFGHARLLEGSIFDATTDGRRRGSPMYMSPEQINGRPATVKSDIFALGIVLFEMLTLHRTWVRDDQDRPLPAFSEPVPAAENTVASVLSRIAGAPRPSVRGLRPSLSEALDTLVEKTLSVDPDGRPPTVEALREAAWPELLRLSDEEEPLARRDAPVTRKVSVRPIPTTEPMDVRGRGADRGWTGAQPAARRRAVGAAGPPSAGCPRRRMGHLRAARGRAWDRDRNEAGDQSGLTVFFDALGAEHSSRRDDDFVDHYFGSLAKRLATIRPPPLQDADQYPNSTGVGGVVGDRRLKLMVPVELRLPIEMVHLHAYPFAESYVVGGIDGVSELLVASVQMNVGLR